MCSHELAREARGSRGSRGGAEEQHQSGRLQCDKSSGHERAVVLQCGLVDHRVHYIEAREKREIALERGRVVGLVVLWLHQKPQILADPVHFRDLPFVRAAVHGDVVRGADEAPKTDGEKVGNPVCVETSEPVARQEEDGGDSHEAVDGLHVVVVEHIAGVVMVMLELVCQRRDLLDRVVERHRVVQPHVECSEVHVCVNVPSDKGQKIV